MEALTRRSERNAGGPLPVKPSLGRAAAGGGGTATPPQQRLTYCFTLKAFIDQTVVGEIHGGYRVDLAYSPQTQSVVIKTASTYPLAQPLLAAQAAITSGNDWAFVSSDAIVDFDSRITLRLDPEGKVLIGGRLRGRADLRKVLPSSALSLPSGATPKQEAAAAVQAWKNGLPAGSHLPLVLAVSFDVPVVALDPSLQAQYDAFRDLSHEMFVGIGKDCFTGARPGAQRDQRPIEIDLFKVGGA
jgi:hypothetical protein